MGNCVGVRAKKQAMRTIQLNPNDQRLQPIKQLLFKSQHNQPTDKLQRIVSEFTEEENLWVRQKIRAHYIFQFFKEQERKNFAKKFYKAECQKECYIFKQSERGDKFYIIYQGSVDIEMNGHVATTLKAGDSFGQLSLLYYAGRAASAKSTSKTILFVIDSRHFRMILKDINLKNGDKIRNLINRVQIFTFLSPKQKSSIMKHLVRIPYKKNQKIFEVGDFPNCFYIVEKGSIALQIPNQPEIVVQQYQSFGQNCFSSTQRRAGTATSRSDDTVLLALGKKEIQRSLGQNIQALTFYSINKWAVSKCELFKSFNAREIEIISALFTIRFSEGTEVIMEEGFHPIAIVVCLQGTINGKSKGAIFCTQYFTKFKQHLDRDVVKDDRGHFSYLTFKSLSKIKKQFLYPRSNPSVDIKGTLSPKLSALMVSTKDNSRKNSAIRAISKTFKDYPAFQNVEMLKKIEVYEHGSLYIARDQIHDNNIFLVKIFNKVDIVKHNLEERVINEKRIIQSPKALGTIAQSQCFIDTKRIYFMSCYHNGVTLGELVQYHVQLDKAMLVNLMASLIFIVEKLNQDNIVYRNFKPERIIIDSRGKVCLNDFSWSKILNENQLFRTYTIVGTPHYMAPEVIESRGYTITSDYWALGVLFYYFYFGLYPFGNDSDNAFDVLKQIHTKKLQFPDGSSQDQPAIQLMKQLLQKQPHLRIAEQDFERIKKMEYFSETVWDSHQMRVQLPQVMINRINENLSMFRSMPGKNILEENINYEDKYGGMAQQNTLELWNDYLL